MDILESVFKRAVSTFYPQSLHSAAARRELCVFSNASTKVIATVAFLKITDAAGNNHVGFIMGKAKLTPLLEQTILRLEFCAAVLAVELKDLISAELDLQLNAITIHIDSEVVLGYISN